MKQLIFTFTFLTISFGVFGQAWTKAKGDGFYKLDFTSLNGNKLFADDSKIIDYQDYSFNTVSLYGEYGITDKLTLVSYIPVLQSNTLKATSGLAEKSNSGFGDIDIAMRYALSKEKFPLALTLLLGIPTGEYVETNELYTGDGEFNQMLKIASGAGGDKWWVQGGIGFNNRNTNFSDELRFDFELGYKLFNKKLFTILKFGGVSPFDNGKAPVSKTGLFSNNVAYFAPALELMYYVKPKFGIMLRGAGAGANARNVQATPSVSFGVFMEN